MVQQRHNKGTTRVQRYSGTTVQRYNATTTTTTTLGASPVCEAVQYHFYAKPGVKYNKSISKQSLSNLLPMLIKPSHHSNGQLTATTPLPVKAEAKTQEPMQILKQII
jgi:hypothetical protein